MQKIEIEISDLQIKILQNLESNNSYCVGYDYLGDIADRNTLKPNIHFLKTIGLVQYFRGLMNDDGEVAGSGFCRTLEGDKFLEKYNL
jgi:hypothetical protein